MIDFLFLLILRPKFLKFIGFLFLGFVFASCVLAFLAWITRSLGI
jgi:hypothetical protein